MSESEPIEFRPRCAGGWNAGASGTVVVNHDHPQVVCFNRHELNDILAVYGRKLAEGEWRDYALDMGRERAVFSVFRRTSECPIYRIEKSPKLARRQGAYAVVAATGLILKRGNDLKRVLAVLDKSLKLVNR